MNSRGLGVGALLCALVLPLLMSCGKSSDTGNKITSPTNPANSSPTNLTTTTSATDSRLPDLSKAVELILDDSKTYSDLHTISQVAFQTVLGPTYLQLTAGQMLFAFEADTEAFGAIVPAVANLSSVTSTAVESIFSDAQVIFHISGTLKGSGKISGSASYHMRQSGETACEAVACQVCYVWGCVPSACDAATINNATTTCRNFVNNGNFKEVGTFSVSPAVWVQ